jgi:hypothetical protein
VSSRHTRSFFGVMLAVVFALSAVVVAPASAKLTKHQKAHIRKQLKRAIKKNPRLIKSKRFIKKASLVDFTLPVTIRLRTHAGAAGANTNSANIDLGPSLGQRQIGLGGTLPAEIKFHDSFDGGALGNVDLTLLPDSTNSTGLTTTSIPLLWNTQVSDPTTHWFAAGTPLSGCGDFKNSNPGILNPSPNPASQDGPGKTLQVPNPSPPPANFSGVPFFTPLGAFAGTVDEYPGVDSIDNVAVSNQPGIDNNIGNNPNPFPTGIAPGGGSYNAQDSVLRTGALSLGVAPVGSVDLPSSDSVQIGKSGGEANLFGNIPGKNTAVDVTVSLSTAINSIIREVDPEPQTLISGQKWPAEAFVCRQAWTGAVQNYITDVKLQGTLKISPAIDPDGSLRIAKTILSSPTPSRVALAACLLPYSTFADENATNASDTTTVNVPDDPINELSARSAPTGVPCNSTPTQLVQDANVSPLTTPDNPPYTTQDNGSQVAVSGDLNVTHVDAEVLIGDTIP